MKIIIQLNKKTVQILKDLMEKMNFETYDDLIKALIREKWVVLFDES